MASSPGRVTGTGVSMDRLAAFLGEPRAALGRVVVNQTGLAGSYSFTLNLTPEGVNPSGKDAAPPMPAALQEQLGSNWQPQELRSKLL
jgi:uncharacterized protein (TIGR03435 family)